MRTKVRRGIVESIALLIALQSAASSCPGQGCTATIYAPSICAMPGQSFPLPASVTTSGGSINCLTLPCNWSYTCSCSDISTGFNPFGGVPTIYVSGAASPGPHSGTVTFSGWCGGAYPVGNFVSASHSLTITVGTTQFNPSASPTSGSAPLQVTFGAASSYCTFASWNFGDGTTGGFPYATHVYQLPGTYYSSIVVSSFGGPTQTYPGPTISVTPPATSLAGITPSHGSALGGTQVTLTGSGFLQGVTQVLIGGIAATQVTIQGPTSLTCVVPPYASGPATVPVTVSHLWGQATLVNGFTWLPAILSANPPILSPTGGAQQVTFGLVGLTSGTQLHAGGLQLPTTPVTGQPTQLQTTIPPVLMANTGALMMQASIPAVPNVGSDPFPLPLVVASNVGALAIEPLVTQPGGTVGVTIVGMAPLTPVTLAIELTPPALMLAFPDPLANFALEVGTPNLTPLVDGMGVFGPSTGHLTTSNGRFVFSATLPPVTLGTMTKLQAVWVDPSSSVGWRLTWALPWFF